jgi:hypothetical protein
LCNVRLVAISVIRGQSSWYEVYEVATIKK